MLSATLIKIALPFLVFAASDFVVYRAKHRPAEELVAMAAPLLKGKVALSNLNEKIVLDGTKSGVEAALRLFAELDRAPRKYRISTRLISAQRGDSQVVAAEGDALFQRVQLSKRSGLLSPSATRVVVGGMALGAQKVESQSMGQGEQSVEVLEGREAMVAGITAKVRGNASGAVTMDLVQKENANPSLSLSSQVSVQPGQWQTVGNLSQSTQAKQGEILGKGEGRGEGKKEIQVRVDVLP